MVERWRTENLAVLRTGEYTGMTVRIRGPGSEAGRLLVSLRVYRQDEIFEVAEAELQEHVPFSRRGISFLRQIPRWTWVRAMTFALATFLSGPLLLWAFLARSIPGLELSALFSQDNHGAGQSAMFLSGLFSMIVFFLVLLDPPER